MHKKLFAFIGLGIAVSSPALAFQDIPFDTQGVTLPFTNTPRGIQDYANKQNWGSKRKVTFTDIGDRSVHRTPCIMDTFGMKRIYCGGGYVTINDPLGTEVCELKNDYTSGGLIYDSTNGKLEYRTNRCSKR